MDSVFAFLRRSLKRFLHALKTALRDWLPALRRFRELLRRFKEEDERPDRERRALRAPCIPIQDPAYKRPDPMIYAQFYLMELGLAVTWDNPDIELRKNGVPVPSSGLEKNTLYEIRARIWNNSTEAPVVGLPVFFSYLAFGIGTTSALIGSTSVNLGVKGGPNHPAFPSIPWTTPDVEGHYCIQVWLLWADDINHKNNYGQENTDVLQAQSPATSLFALRNNTPERQTYRFEMDGYRVPDLPRCQAGVEGNAGSVAAAPRSETLAVPPAHDRRCYPLPEAWIVKLEPAQPTLEPDQGVTIQVSVTPPDDFDGIQPLNISAFHGRGLAGGVTLVVKRGSPG